MDATSRISERESPTIMADYISEESESESLIYLKQSLNKSWKERKSMKRTSVKGMGSEEAYKSYSRTLARLSVHSSSPEPPPNSRLEA